VFCSLRGIVNVDVYYLCTLVTCFVTLLYFVSSYRVRRNSLAIKSKNWF
jgi:hypothetical protein